MIGELRQSDRDYINRLVDDFVFQQTNPSNCMHAINTYFYNLNIPITTNVTKCNNTYIIVDLYHLETHESELIVTRI